MAANSKGWERNYGIISPRNRMVSVAQRPKAPGCGPGYRGFESLHSPHLFLSQTSFIYLRL